MAAPVAAVPRDVRLPRLPPAVSERAAGAVRRGRVLPATGADPRPRVTSPERESTRVIPRVRPPTPKAPRAPVPAKAPEPVSRSVRAYADPKGDFKPRASRPGLSAPSPAQVDNSQVVSILRQVLQGVRELVESQDGRGLKLQSAQPVSHVWQAVYQKEE